ncbi:MAG: hypothetical protein OHK0039_37850 [Bacteroidia bacterium]
MRLFLGIPLPADTLAALRHWRAGCGEPRGLRWIPDENLHVTAFFFGEVAEEALPNFLALIHLALRPVSAFDLAFDALVLAPRPREPRMVWARYRRLANFQFLCDRMADHFGQVLPGHQIRHKPVPHITLARLRDADLASLSLQAAVPPLPARELVLWSSTLSPDGATYTPVGRYPLR